jgi:hypothetical protein
MGTQRKPPKVVLLSALYEEGDPIVVTLDGPAIVQGVAPSTVFPGERFYRVKIPLKFGNTSRNVVTLVLVHEGDVTLDKGEGV